MIKAEDCSRMIDPSRLATADSTPAPRRPAFYMAENDRMAGGVPVWDSRRTAPAPAQAEQPSFAETLSYAAQDSATATDESDEFGFFDLLDMVNPLQHIPIVSTLYRGITGDEIKPVARIIGGTVFGGPAGGAMSLANVIIEEETGKDITGNVIAMVQGDTPHWRHTPDDPEQRLNSVLAAAETNSTDGIPPAAMAYARTHTDTQSHRPAYSAATEDDRMAGTRPRFQSADDDNRGYENNHRPANHLAAALPPREAITRLDIASLPVIYEEKS